MISYFTGAQGSEDVLAEENPKLKVGGKRNRDKAGDFEKGDAKRPRDEESDMGSERRKKVRSADDESESGRSEQSVSMRRYVVIVAPWLFA